MSYSRCTLYFLSGTGNTARVAQWMARLAQQRTVETTAVPINRAPDTPFPDDCAQNLVGLLMPTHGFTAPWGMIRFALGLPRSKNRHALVAATRAGTKFGPLFLPGLEGTAAYLIALILALKGYHLRGVRGIDMPSNWITFHPGYSERSALAIGERNRPLAEKFVGNVLDGKRQFRSIVPLLLGLLLLPVSIGYLLFGRFFLAKVLFASQDCDGCGLCAQNCPFQAIRMHGKNPRPYWSFSCESCMRCVSLCPQQAIQGGQSWAVLLWYTTTIPVGVWSLNLLAQHLPWLQSLEGSPLYWLIQYPYFLLCLFVMYWIANRLSRLRLINALLTYTTLTRLPCWRRYREPHTRLQRLNQVQRPEAEDG
ncbi:MAG: EFR1 family ferrodoxin [Candidatus Alcyoniella australis]|nr:EFR1 family ferrodoxin [Candidatus Alcyoniella australis]